MFIALQPKVVPMIPWGHHAPALVAGGPQQGHQPPLVDNLKTCPGRAVPRGGAPGALAPGATVRGRKIEDLKLRI